MNQISKKTIGEVITSCTRYIPPLIGIVATISLLGALPFLNIDQWEWRSVLSLLIGMFSAAYFYFDWLIRENIKQDVDIFTYGNINSCINMAAKQRKNYRTIRIYSLSSGHIHPVLSGIIKERVVSIDEILLLLCDAESEQNLVPVEFEQHTISKIQEWRSLQDSEHLSRVDLQRFSFTPMDFYITFDHAAVVFGRFLVNSSEPSHLEVGMCFCALGDRPDTRMLIQEYVNHFDALRNHGTIIGVDDVTT